MILSCHLLLQSIFFTHKLVPVTSLLCGVGVFWLFGLVFFCLVFVSLFFDVLFCFLDDRDSA